MGTGTTPVPVRTARRSVHLTTAGSPCEACGSRVKYIMDGDERICWNCGVSFRATPVD
jgi:hypothetical protein